MAQIKLRYVKADKKQLHTHAYVQGSSQSTKGGQDNAYMCAILILVYVALFLVPFSTSPLFLKLRKVLLLIITHCLSYCMHTI